MKSRHNVRAPFGVHKTSKLDVGPVAQTRQWKRVYGDSIFNMNSFSKQNSSQTDETTLTKIQSLEKQLLSIVTELKTLKEQIPESGSTNCSCTTELDEMDVRIEDLTGAHNELADAVTELQDQMTSFEPPTVDLTQIEQRLTTLENEIGNEDETNDKDVLSRLLKLESKFDMYKCTCSERITALTTRVGTLEEQNVSLQDALNSANNKISGLQAQIDYMIMEDMSAGGRLQILETAKSEMEANIATLQTQVSSNNGSITLLQSALANTKTTLDDVYDRTKNYNNGIILHQPRLSADDDHIPDFDTYAIDLGHIMKQLVPDYCVNVSVEYDTSGNKDIYSNDWNHNEWIITNILHPYTSQDMFEYVFYKDYSNIKDCPTELDRIATSINSLQEAKEIIETNISELQRRLDAINSCSCPEDVQDRFMAIETRVNSLELNGTSCSCPSDVQFQLDVLSNRIGSVESGLDNKLDKVLSEPITFNWLDKDGALDTDHSKEFTNVIEIFERIAEDLRWSSPVIELANVRIPELIDEKTNINSKIVKLEGDLNSRTSAISNHLDNTDATLNDVRGRTLNYNQGTVLFSDNGNIYGINLHRIAKALFDKLSYQIGTSDEYSMSWTNYGTETEMNELRNTINSNTKVEKSVEKKQLIYDGYFSDIRARTCDWYNGVIITTKTNDDGSTGYCGIALSKVIADQHPEAIVDIPSEAYDNSANNSSFACKWYMADNMTKLRSYIVNNGNGDYQ